MSDLKPRGFFLKSGTASILVGDALNVLRTLPDKSFHCCITSPPYYGLRDYGTAKWVGGDPNCQHGPRTMKNENIGNYRQVLDGDNSKCYHCGARRVDSQIGLEQTPADYVAKLVEVFAEVWRVLRDDGTFWLNLGDSYHNPHGANSYVNTNAIHKGGKRDGSEDHVRANRNPLPGLKNKDLIGIPWRVAFALQDWGWTLRSGIIWAKTAVMPESVQDRPTNSYENVFLLTKGPHYFYDGFAVREDAVIPAGTRAAKGSDERWNEPGVNSRPPEYWTADGTRNMRNVWNFNPEIYPGAHFATFPQALPKRCILAGTSAHGCCPDCGAPYERIVEGDKFEPPKAEPGERKVDKSRHDSDRKMGFSKEAWDAHVASLKTTGWRPTCQCAAAAERSVKAGTSEKGCCAVCGAPWVRQTETEYKHHERWFGDKQAARHSRGKAGVGYNEPIAHSTVGWLPTCDCAEPAKQAVKAGTSERGCCATCGAPWVRQTETSIDETRPPARRNIREPAVTKSGQGSNARGSSTWGHYVKATTTGWQPSCDCDQSDYQKHGRRGGIHFDRKDYAPGHEGNTRTERGTVPHLTAKSRTLKWEASCDHAVEPVPCQVLDPFGGTGVTGMVAGLLARHATLIELNPKFAEMAAERLQRAQVPSSTKDVKNVRRRLDHQQRRAAAGTDEPVALATGQSPRRSLHPRRHPAG